jgi:transcriptional regulator with XRE-family HTH domain
VLSDMVARSRVGDAVKAYRILNGLTQKRLSDKIGVPVATIQSLEVGLRKYLSKEDLEKIDGVLFDGKGEVFSLIPSGWETKRYIPIL